MSWWRLVMRSLVHHRRMNAAVALGVAAATAVLIGALIVGDSVRGSLRWLALDRLGRIDEVLAVDRFFRMALADELSNAPEFQQHYSAAVPVLLFPQGTVEKPGAARATGVLIVGAGEAFWNLGDAAARPAPLPGPDEIVLNEPLAEELNARIGDRLLVRLPKANQVPADSPLGDTTDRVGTIAGLRLVAVVPAQSLGRFSLTTSQTAPTNAYLHPETLQRALNQEGRANALLVAGRGDSGPQARQQLHAALRPTLDDFGIQIDRVRRTWRPAPGQPDQVAYDYFHITTQRMLFEPAAAQAIRRALADRQLQPVSTYVANSITKVNGDPAADISYSVVSGVDSTSALGPLLDEQGQPLRWAPAGERPTTLAAESPDPPLEPIVLNSWAAEDLQARPGDRIRMTYFRPEATHGELAEETTDFTLQAVVPLTPPAEPYSRRREATYDQRPTLANDPDLTPEVEGLTDQASISDWDAPFPVDYSRVRSQDDDYWQDYRTTPKAFLSLATAERLWGSRFGTITSLRLPAPQDLPPDSPAEQAFVRDLQQKLESELAEVQGGLGFAFQPIRQRSLAAAAGTTPFDVLFLALSFFVIAAAVILVMLLFRLSVEQRAAEVGTLLATGFTRRRTAGLLIAEGLIVAAAGSLVGIAAGTGYAWLMITALRTWWVGAITTPFLTMYVTPLSLVIGYFSGLLVSGLTIALSLLFMRRVTVRSLLAGRASGDRRVRYGSRPGWWLVCGGLLAASLLLAIQAARSGGETQAASFVGAGAAVLAALLIGIRGYLLAGGLLGGFAPWPASRPSRLSLVGLSARNAARNPGRSTMTIGLMAVASFLILSMGAFRAEPTVRGTGGFDLLAESDQPIFEDLNAAAGRDLLLGDRGPELEGSFVASLRLQPGDDASCTNLYRPTQPRILGVTDALIRHFDGPDATSFGWSATAATDPPTDNPWRLLNSASSAGESVPVILDVNTARYSLQLYGGIGEEFELEYTAGQPIRFRVVGLLSTCILQGNLLIGERDFLRLFPEVAGYRVFLVRTAPGDRPQVARTLEDRLGDQGFDAVGAEDRLRDLLAVQNTYLSTFQTLGALGLLLGTFGLATVQVRNVVERRSELALMRAAGFRRSRLGGLVMWENVGLLLAGLLSGLLAALVAVLPHVYLGGVSVPWRDLGVMLAIVLLAGVLSSLASVRTTLRAPLLPALRGD